MKIIIIENELYLAQSIAGKLAEYNFETEIYSSVKDAMNKYADIYLLSTNLPGQNFMPLIEKHKDRNVLLMVNYINNDTVSEPLKAGAKDYIVKPFMIEELIRKIEHFHKYRMIQERNRFYEEYLNHIYKEVESPISLDNLPIPVFIECNYQKAVDKLILELSRTGKNILAYIPLDEDGWKERAKALDDEHIGYLPYFEKLKKSEREILYKLLENKKFIITNNSSLDCEVPYPVIEVKVDNRLYDHDDILTIDEYVQYIVKTFQYKFPDTELSKKLGISRKSLWEKRKKYELFKRK